MTPFEYQQAAARTEKLPGTPAIPEPEKYRLLHGALGLTTEVGELVDSVKRHVIYGKPLDRDNIIEEAGDLLWYLALIANTLEFDIGDAMALNIDKLRRRYPDKYTDADALTRADKPTPDLEAQRAAQANAALQRTAQVWHDPLAVEPAPTIVSNDSTVTPYIAIDPRLPIPESAIPDNDAVKPGNS